MAQLDPLLGALVDKKAQELVMREGRPAALRLDGKLRPVSQKRLDRGQIARLLSELSDQIDAAADTIEPARFHYSLNPDRHFECEVREHEGRLTARVVPAAAPQTSHADSTIVDLHDALGDEINGAGRTMAPVAEAEPIEDPAEAVVQTSHEAPSMREPTVVVPEAVEPARPARPAKSATPVKPVRVEPTPIEVEPATMATDEPDSPPAPAHPDSDEIAAMAAEIGVPAYAGETAAPRSNRQLDGTAAAIEKMLRYMVAKGASDLHLSSGETPMLRLHGEMIRIENTGPVSPDAMVALLEPIMPEHNRREFAETCDTDFAHEIPGVARFRANIFADRKGRGAVFRMIPSEILTAEQLGLPPAVLELCELSKGLVLVTGPTGSGKSTTLAAMIDHINRTRTDHIITIEDPVEFVHPNYKCLVNQREIITHTKSFKRALRAALREDPDIVLVGEMRDLETIAIAIETAETGHLVFGTLHTTTAISTVDRIIDQFPADRQAQIRTMLSESLRGVVAQTLLKKNGGGRVAALEVLIVTAAISNLIREGKTFQIPSLMQTGKKLGMRLLNDALIDLVKSKTVDPDEALRKAIDKGGFQSLLKSAGFRATKPA